jgi:cellulose synthase/poly-beta-1,6-N-acetylglucosamine synthase-like glycosyltransferase
MILSALIWTLLALAFLLAIPITVLFVECVVALLPTRTAVVAVNSSSHLKTAVLIPAHNEASGLQRVLTDLLPQLSDRDRLVVIADNCTDETAHIARSVGATVIERRDATHRGKGYALDYGVRFLADQSNGAVPDVVVIVDADCILQPGTLQQIAHQAAKTGRPTQAIYLMEQPAQPKPRDAVSALAFLVKNLVRPRGLAWLQVPCSLTGTGMAFPWAVIQAAALASGNIVEDMQLGVDLAIAGYPPLFCDNTRVTGLLPQQEQAAKKQRTRWEHGHLQTILTQVPKLLQAALSQKRFDLLAIAFDLAIPPLSLLVLLWMAVAGLSLLAGVAGLSWLPGLLLVSEGVLIFLSILVAWLGFGRAELPAQALLAAPLYLLWKIPLYFAFLIRPQTEWVRTDRDPVKTSGSQH